MNRCYLGVSFNELLVWLRTGSHRLYPGRLIDSYQDKPALPLSGQLAERVLESLPSHESTTDVILVAMDAPPRRQIGNNDLTVIESRHIVALYALRERDRYFLQHQLGDSYRLSKTQPLAEELIERLIVGRRDDDARQAGRALVEIVRGSSDEAEAFEQRHWANLIRLLEQRDEGNLTPTPGDWLSGLFGYSRSGAISKEDIGFFLDLGNVLKTVNPHTPPFGYGEAIKEWKKEHPHASLYDLYRGFKDDRIVEHFDQYAGRSGTMLASLVFLKLTHIIRETDCLTHGVLVTLVKEFQEHRFHPFLTEGLWWCGAYWGFTRFAPLFHEKQYGNHPPILPCGESDAEMGVDTRPSEPRVVDSVSTVVTVSAEVPEAIPPKEDRQQIVSDSSVSEPIPSITDAKASREGEEAVIADMMLPDQPDKGGNKASAGNPEVIAVPENSTGSRKSRRKKSGSPKNAKPSKRDEPGQDKAVDSVQQPLDMDNSAEQD